MFFGKALASEMVGLAQIESGARIVRFCGRDLGEIDLHGRFLPFATPRARLRVAPESAATSEK